MAAAVARSMSMGGQNMHLYQNNFIYPNSTIISSPSPTSSTNQVISNHGKRNIAPAPPPGNVLVNSNVMNNNNSNNSNSAQNGNNKKRINFAQVTYGGHQPTSVARRNARERNRVKQVNNGFANLRQHIPQDIIDTLPKAGRGASKKLSKVDTLRMAVEYIRRLVDLLDDANDTQSTSVRSSYDSAASYHLENSMHYSIPTCSEASASPTPSYTSESSHCNNIYAPTITNQIYLTEHYDHYEHNISTKSSDEELLDVITNWQDENNFMRQS